MNLQDLTFIDEGNSDFLDPEKKLINFDKKMRIANIIQSICTLQNSPYKIRPVSELVDSLVSVTGFDGNHDQISYQISKYIENPSGVLSHDDISDIDLPAGVVLYAPKINILPSKKSHSSVINFGHTGQRSRLMSMDETSSF